MCQKYICSTGDIILDETKFKISKEELLRWHEILQEYFMDQPNERTAEKFFGKIGFGKEITDEICRDIIEMQKNDQILKIIDELYENFDDLI